MIALRSNSLLPGILFHFLFNSLAILRERASVQLADGHAEEFQRSVWSSFAILEAGGLRYTWLTLVICGAAASVCLWWVWQAGRAKVTSDSGEGLFPNGLVPAKQQQPTCAS